MRWQLNNILLNCMGVTTFNLHGSCKGKFVFQKGRERRITELCFNYCMSVYM